MFEDLLSSVEYLGSLADKAGPRPLRGLLTGKPRELLSAIPFSDTMGWTDPKQISTGRDVTDYWGATDPHDQGLGATLTGVGAEMALDPFALYGAARMGLKGLGKGIGALAARSGPSNPVHHLASLIGKVDDASSLGLVPGKLKADMAAPRRGMVAIPPLPGKGKAINDAADLTSARCMASPTPSTSSRMTSGPRGPRA